MRRPPPPIFRLVALLATVTVAAACGDGSGPTPPLTGSYTLRTVNGAAAPAVYACGVSVSNGTLTIGSDSLTLHLTVVDVGSGTLETRREYTRSSDGKRLVAPEPSGNTASRDTVTLAGGGRVTYRAWLPVSASCTGTLAVQADLGFRHD